MAVSKERKAELVAQYGKGEKDSGSAEVQVALLTERIKGLTEHMKVHPKDFHTRRGLLMLVGKRRRLLSYIKARNIEEYRALIKSLGIRDNIQYSGSSEGRPRAPFFGMSARSADGRPGGRRDGPPATGLAEIREKKWQRLHTSSTSTASTTPSRPASWPSRPPVPASCGRGTPRSSSPPSSPRSARTTTSSR